jgi:Fe-S cluster biogenesis protein NfuA
LHIYEIALFSLLIWVIFFFCRKKFGGKMLDKAKVQAVIDKVRPSLQADGGDCELIKVREDGVVEVKLQGACGSCPMATLTLKAGIERVLKEEIPEVKEVISV